MNINVYIHITLIFRFTKRMLYENKKNIKGERIFLHQNDTSTSKEYFVALKLVKVDIGIQYVNSFTSHSGKLCTLLKIQLILVPTTPTKDSAVMMIVTRTLLEDLCPTD